MTPPLTVANQLSDRALIEEVKVAVTREREATAGLIALLAELDARRLYLGEGCSSLFTYCTQVLRLSEHAAYGRIEAARAARRFPMVLELLADGAVTLTAVTLLAPLLTPDNHREVLADARYRSKREVEQLVARLRPQAAVQPTVRKKERGFIEFHHVEPYAAGGAATTVNLELRCRAHNLHEAEEYFGKRLPLLLREATVEYSVWTELEARVRI